jgi:serine/threonine-protein kinase haspin
MPPKQVYGRRTKATASTYAKFISPDKDDDGLLGKSSARNEPRKKSANAGVEEIGEQLKVLEIRDSGEKAAGQDAQKTDGQKRYESKESDAKFDEASQPRRRKGVGRKEVQHFSVSPKLQDDSAVSVVEKPKRGRKPRKALGSRAANAETEDKSATSQQKCNRTGENRTQTKDEDICANFGNLRLDAPVEEQTSKDNQNEPVVDGEHDVDIQKPLNKEPFTPTRNRPGKISKSEAQSHPPQPMTCMNDIYAEYISSLLALSSQNDIISFDDWSNRLDECVNVEKIAEASFSEVYRLTVKDSLPGCASESVLKVVALKMAPSTPLPSEQNDCDRPRRKADTSKQLKKEKEKREEEDQWKSKVEDVHCEIRLLQNLNHIPGFTNFRELTIVQGRPSNTFGRAWKDWNVSRPKGKKSYFPDPTKKSSYEEMQLWAVIEMQDAGTDCGKVIEAGGLQSIWEVWDVFWGACLSVAKAEEGCRFEHRDLHMDNICIRASTDDTCLPERWIRNPLKRRLGFAGLETTVIDYTLSRADIIALSPNTSRRTSSSSVFANSPVSTPPNERTRIEDVAYLDLNKDHGLFEGNGEDEYQYEIYRYMRGAALHNDPLKNSDPFISAEELPPDTPRRSPRKHEDTALPVTPRRSPRKNPSTPPSKDIWKQFHPKTNLVWIHFILYSLLQNIVGNEPHSMSPSDIMYNIVEADPTDAPKIHKKAVKLHKILNKIAQLLDPAALGPKSKLRSTRDLVIVALEAGWLNPADVSGRK